MTMREAMEFDGDHMKFVEIENRLMMLLRK